LYIYTGVGAAKGLRHCAGLDPRALKSGRKETDMKISFATVAGAITTHIKNHTLPMIENEGLRNLADGIFTAVEIGCTIAGMCGA
jgi:hypothetical protein